MVTPYFVMFIGVWVYLRHYINLRILWATLTEFRTVGPFILNWETEQYKCWISQYVAFGLLACLQAVNLFWLFLIVRIAKNFVFTSVVVDERSDDDDTEEEEEEEIEVVEKKEDAPVLLINGKPEKGEVKAEVKTEEGVKERRTRRK